MKKKSFLSLRSKGPTSSTNSGTGTSASLRSAKKRSLSTFQRLLGAKPEVPDVDFDRNAYPSHPRSEFPVISPLSLEIPSLVDSQKGEIDEEDDSDMFIAEVSCNVASTKMKTTKMMTLRNLAVKSTHQGTLSIVDSIITIVSRDESTLFKSHVSDILSIKLKRAALLVETTSDQTLTVKTASALQTAQRIVCSARAYLGILDTALDSLLPTDFLTQIRAGKFNGSYKPPKVKQWKLLAAEQAVRSMVFTARFAYGDSVDLIEYLGFLRHFLGFTGREKEANFYLVEISGLWVAYKKNGSQPEADAIRYPEDEDQKEWMRRHCVAPKAARARRVAALQSWLKSVGLVLETTQ